MAWGESQLIIGKAQRKNLKLILSISIVVHIQKCGI